MDIKMAKKQKMMVLMMLLNMILATLAGCGNDSASVQIETPATADSYEGQINDDAMTAADIEDFTKEKEVLKPSLDEVIEDIFQYAEIWDMQISEDASVVISNMYAAGNTDAYLIFEYLCSDGLCTPKSGGDITAGPILIQGSFSKGFLAAQMNLSTGELENIFSFSNDNNYSFAFDTEKQNYMSCYFTKQLFDESMTKLAVSWRDLTDSSQHVGWVDRDGNLTDVTATIHPYTTDFSSKIPHDNYALFSPDGYFVFTDLDKECYCFIDVDSMSVIKEVPYIIDDSSYYSKEFGNKAYQITFMPNGELGAMWHATSSVDNFRDFGGCYIDMPNSDELETWDYLYDNKILCIGYDGEGYFIGEIGEGIGELRVLSGSVRHSGISCWNYAYHGDFTNHGRDGIEVLEITPHTDYRLECCVYSNGQIAFIGSRGNERFLFTVEEAENSNPTQISPIDNSWQLLFWK